MTKLFSYTAIPATDFERAFAFYSAVTEGGIQRNPQVPFPMAYFVDSAGRNVGHLFQLPGFAPSEDGVIVYMEPTHELDVALARIEAAGGTVRMKKTSLGPGKGHWALFLDSEGNRLALHSSD
jgi:uncharacterized protein